MKLRKTVTGVLTALMIFFTSGCESRVRETADSGNANIISQTSLSTTESTSENSSENSSESTAESTQESTAEISQNTSQSTTESAENPAPAQMHTASEIVKQMRVGWNLGNTLDALGGTGLSSETAWGNPVTTKAMIDTVRAGGFNVLRVPVSWGEHLNADYNIDKAWLDRVGQVVDYGIENDMFVILNTHHEEWYMPRESDVSEDLEVLEKLWSQIAERFKDYGEKLLFEGVNEPRLRGTGEEWTGTPEARDIVNRYAETFVRTVRASGGNNAQRTLLISPYAASSNPENLTALKVPENAGNIIVSVHAYLPYDFALNVNGTSEYDPNDGSIKWVMDNIKLTFIDRNIPVVITEFGSLNKNNTDARLRCLDDFLNSAKNIGVPCVWWDNGAVWSDGENFGLLNRTDGGWYFPEIVDEIKRIVGV